MSTKSAIFRGGNQYGGHVVGGSVQRHNINYTFPDRAK